MVRYTSPIDPHVHFRGEEYFSKNYLEIGFKHARLVGLAAVIEHPNMDPMLTTSDAVARRLDNAKKYSIGVKHGIHIGVTKDIAKARAALEAVMKKESGLVSDKIFYAPSTGDMGILDEEVQSEIWELKGSMGYNGVSVGHFEDEKVFEKIEFDHKRPITHSWIRIPESELKQVQRQLKYAVDSKFKGTFYIAHTSNPETVDFIESERPKIPFEIAIEVTFHHMFMNDNAYSMDDGAIVKVNPPLRKKELQKELLKRVIEGKVQVIGTDHAPHPYGLKIGDTPPSGIPTIPFWPKAIGLLRKCGITEKLLEDITFNNTNRIFKLGLKKRTVSVEYNTVMWNDYLFNPFSTLELNLFCNTL